MSWNYRVVLKGGTYGIHEVFYTPEGKLKSLSEECITLGALETFEALKGDLELINGAFDKPVINYSDLSEIND